MIWNMGLLVMGVWSGQKIFSPKNYNKTGQNCQKQPFWGSENGPKANKLRSTDL